MWSIFHHTHTEYMWKSFPWISFSFSLPLSLISHFVWAFQFLSFNMIFVKSTSAKWEKRKTNYTNNSREEQKNGQQWSVSSKLLTRKSCTFQKVEWAKWWYWWRALKAMNKIWAGIVAVPVMNAWEQKQSPGDWILENPTWKRRMNSIYDTYSYETVSSTRQPDRAHCFHTLVLKEENAAKKARPCFSFNASLSLCVRACVSDGLYYFNYCGLNHSRCFW